MCFLVGGSLVDQLLELTDALHLSHDDWMCLLHAI